MLPEAKTEPPSHSRGSPAFAFGFGAQATSGT
jgi:hypothetical protein